LLQSGARAGDVGVASQAAIEASGTNHDGRMRGMTGTSGTAQTALLKDTFKKVKLAAKDVDWVISHGTGTELGDMVEAHALQDVFRGDVPRHNSAVTSTKSNFGHTFAASGLVSVIAMVQAMQAGRTPASLHCAEPNDHVDWDHGPLYLNTSAKPWPVDAERGRIGSVSAFGISGTNAAVVVSDCPEPTQAAAPNDAPQLIALSAKTESSLKDMATRLEAHLRTREAGSQSLAEISKTLLTGRHHFTHRIAFVTTSKDDAAQRLRQFGDGLGAPHQGVVDLGDAVQQIQSAQPADLDRLAEQFCAGAALDWGPLFATETRRVSLPGTVFARDRCWIDLAEPKTAPKAVSTDEPAEPKSMTGLLLLSKALEHTNARALGNVVWGAEFVPSGPLHTQDLESGGFAIFRDDTRQEAAWLGSPADLPKDAPQTVRLPRLRAGLRPLPVLPGIDAHFGNRTRFMGTVTCDPGDLAGVLDRLWHAVSQHIHREHRQAAWPASLGYFAQVADIPDRVTFAGALRADGTEDFADYDITLYDESGRPIALFTDLSCAIGFAGEDIDLTEVMA